MDLIKNRNLSSLYSTRFYPLLLHYILQSPYTQQKKEAARPKDIYLPAIMLLIMGMNPMNGTVASLNEMKAMLLFYVPYEGYILHMHFRVDIPEVPL